MVNNMKYYKLFIFTFLGCPLSYILTDLFIGNVASSHIGHKAIFDDLCLLLFGGIASLFLYIEGKKNEK